MLTFTDLSRVSLPDIRPGFGPKSCASQDALRIAEEDQGSYLDS